MRNLRRSLKPSRQRGAGLLIVVFIVMVVGALSAQMTEWYLQSRLVQRRAEIAHAEHLLHANAAALAKAAQANGQAELVWTDTVQTMTITQDAEGAWEIKGSGLHPAAGYRATISIREDEKP